MSEKQTRAIRLFLSHASEQKPLVSQVHDLLNGQFELWFDKEALTGGDSLFREISDGLVWCDYGVVFLSKEYLAKGWTNAEFGGLWTKYIRERAKVILPIWYDVSADEVYRFSPMLHDLTAISSKDPAQIAGWISKAVGVAEQSREVHDPLKRALAALQSDVAAATLWRSWSASDDGAKAVLDEWERIAETANRILSDGNNTLFSVSRGEVYSPKPIIIEGKPVFVDGEERVDGLRIIYLLFSIRTATNIVSHAECTQQLILRTIDPFTKRFEEAHSLSFKPYCTSDGKPIWRMGPGKFVDTRQLVEAALQLLIEITHKAQNLGRITRRSLS